MGRRRSGFIEGAQAPGRECGEGQRGFAGRGLLWKQQPDVRYGPGARQKPGLGLGGLCGLRLRGLGVVDIGSRVQVCPLRKRARCGADRIGIVRPEYHSHIVRSGPRPSGSRSARISMAVLSMRSRENSSPSSRAKKPIRRTLAVRAPNPQLNPLSANVPVHRRASPWTAVHRHASPLGRRIVLHGIAGRVRFDTDATSVGS